MSRTYGGSQPSNNERYNDIDGYLGPCLPKLSVGDTQSMVFKPHETGPWYLSQEQREAQKHDQLTGQISRVKRSKKLLINALSEAGVRLPEQGNYTRGELQAFANRHGVDICEDRPKIIRGWVGQPKGLLQVLWERGFISETSLDKYTVDGRKHPITCEIDLQYSLKHLLAECIDFKEEETALQYLGTRLGVKVELTPKFHAELAGEGVEYCWAHAKAYYRRAPLSRKRGRENFKQLVRECICPVNVMTKERVEIFAARAQAYICTYHHLDQELQNNPHHELLYNRIQMIMKEFKGHRCALDFDRGFVNSVLKEVRKKTTTTDEEME